VKSAWRDGDRVRTVELEPRGGAIWRVRVDGIEFDVAAEALADGRMRLRTESGDTVAEVTAAGARRFVRVGTLEFVLDRETTVRGKGARLQHGMAAPMTGVVTRVLVQAGDPVSKGQPLVALEAMKMEHMIRAPREGRVKSVLAAPGAMVQGGAELVELDPESSG
jgi:3-methylcrotonyl-CoA carboxylase alpha subunit